ncbi:MAG: endonuclease MutS2 [Bacillota bacterium]
MNKKSRKTLEFDKILNQISKFAFSQNAKDMIMDLQPFQNKNYIEKLLDEVEEASKILYEHSLSPSFNFDDITFALEKASIMSVLTMGELLKISKMLRISRNLQSLIAKVNDDTIVLLKDTASKIYINKELEESIDKAILSETEMSDNASGALRNIRNKIRKIGDNIKARLHNFVNSSEYSKCLQDNIVTIRNGRYVIPLKAEHRGAIAGLVHDQSASGSTVYLEPMAIVEMNNDLKTASIEENKEIEKILREFTVGVSNNVEDIKNSFDIITELDVIFAKAMYAQSQKAVKPVINEKGYINISKGRHPLIKKEDVVSNSIYLGKDFNMLFITGPNTGGKTVCLKLAGLLVLMALSGIYTPAAEAEIAIFENIFCDIGDEQSIEQNLSTFSSHMNNIKNIIDNITENTFVLLDELGAGTDPAEGASLALSIAKYILDTGARAMVTTHYNELKEYAMITKGMQNASMEFDCTTYSPTYKLTIGIPGASNALLIAKRLGLKQEIINDAKKGLKGQKIEFENVLKELEKTKKKFEINLEEIQTLKMDAKAAKKEAEIERNKLAIQKERLNQSVRKETKRLVEKSMLEANEIIDTLKEMLENPDEKSLFKAYEIRKRLNKFVVNEENEFEFTIEEEKGDIKVGDTVLVKTLNSEGKVVSVNPVKDEATIQMGALTSKISLKDLTKIKSAPKKKKPTSSLKVTLNNKQITSEINLIGQTSDEIDFYLESFLDQAYVNGLKELRVVHGIGEGILRKAVAKLLKKHKYVESFREGRFGEGGKGVTIVYLK